MDKHFGTLKNQHSMSQQNVQVKSTFCYNENIHTIEDLIAEVNKCQLEYDTKKKTNASLQELLTKANSESDRLENVYRDLQQSVAERKKHNAQSVQTLESLRSCVKVTKDNVAMVKQENLEAQEDLINFKKVWIEKYNVNVNKLSNIEAQYGNRLANTSVVQKLQKEIESLEQERDNEIIELNNLISADKNAWDIMKKTIVEFAQLMVERRNLSKKHAELLNILHVEKYNLAKNEAMQQEKQAKVDSMHLEKKAMRESLEKQRRDTEVCTSVDKPLSDAKPKSTPRYTNLQQYMASWTGVQQKKLSSSLDSNTGRKDTPRPKSRFSTGMFVSSLKVPEFSKVKQLSDVTNQMVSPITKSNEVVMERVSHKIQNKVFDVAKMQMKFGSPSVENFGSPILGSKLKTFKENVNNTSVKPKESKSVSSSLTKPNTLIPLKPFPFKVNSVQAKSVKNFSTDCTSSIQVFDNIKKRLPKQSEGAQDSSLMNTNSKSYHSTEHQNKDNEVSNSLCSDSGSWKTPESSLSSTTEFFTPDTSPSLPHSNMNPPDIQKVIQENDKDIQGSEKDIQENIVMELTQNEPQINDLHRSLNEQVGVNETYSGSSSDHEISNEIIPKDVQNMELDNSQYSSQDSQEMELTLGYGTSSQGFDLSQDANLVDQEDIAKTLKIDKKSSETDMEVDPKNQKLTEDAFKQQESMDVSENNVRNSSSMIVEPPESANNSLESDETSAYFCSTPASQEKIPRTSFGNISDLNQMDITIMEQSELSSSNGISVGTDKIKDNEDSGFSPSVAEHIEISKAIKTNATPQSTELLSNESLMQESDSNNISQVAEHSEVKKKSEVIENIDAMTNDSRSTSTLNFSLGMSQSSTKDVATNALSIFGSPPSKIDESSKETSSFNFSLFGENPQGNVDAGSTFSLFGDTQDSQSSSQKPGGGFSLFQDSQSTSEKPGIGFSLFHDSQASSEKPGGSFSLFGNDAPPKADNDSIKTGGFSLFGDSQGNNTVDNSSSGVFNFDFGGGNSGGEDQDGGGFSFNLFNTSTSQSNHSSTSNTGGAFSLF